MRNIVWAITVIAALISGCATVESHYIAECVENELRLLGWQLKHARVCEAPFNLTRGMLVPTTILPDSPLFQADREYSELYEDGGDGDERFHIEVDIEGERDD